MIPNPARRLFGSPWRDNSLAASIRSECETPGWDLDVCGRITRRAARAARDGVARLARRRRRRDRADSRGFHRGHRSGLLTARCSTSHDVRVEALMVTDRAATDDSYFASESRTPTSWCCVTDQPLHARSVWRANDFGAAINMASTLIAVGEVASAICEVMIDPRGGAPARDSAIETGPRSCRRRATNRCARTRSLLA